ncbi:hypothetical protein R6Q59_006386 [Mikania micrantha]
MSTSWTKLYQITGETFSFSPIRDTQSMKDFTPAADKALSEPVRQRVRLRPMDGTFHQDRPLDRLRGELWKICESLLHDENVNSQPFIRWRDGFVFCAEAIYKAQAETGEIKGHYLNATAGNCDEMMKRAAFARELGVPIVMHDYLTGGLTANTTLAHYCRDNGLLLHIHRAMHAVIDRQKNHGMHFRVRAKALRMSGGDHIHSGTVVAVRRQVVKNKSSSIQRKAYAFGQKEAFSAGTRIANRRIQLQENQDSVVE